MNTTCIKHEYNMHTTCMQHAYNMHTNAHDIMRTTYIQHAYNMRTACVQHAYNMHTLYPDRYSTHPSASAPSPVLISQAGNARKASLNLAGTGVRRMRDMDVDNRLSREFRDIKVNKVKVMSGICKVGIFNEVFFFTFFYFLSQKK